MSTDPQTIPDAFQRAVEHWRRSWPQEKTAATSQSSQPPLTIAISREVGSGGKQIAEAVAARLTWPVYDRELVEQIAKDSGVRTEMMERVDEHNSSFLRETLEAFIGAPTMGGAGYAHRLGQTLAGLGAHGACVIVGRGATAILPPETTLSIRIVAALKDRIAAFAQRRDISQSAARPQVQQLHQERADFVTRYFHQDINDPHEYDLVINHSRLGDDACTEVILRAVEQRQRTVT